MSIRDLLRRSTDKGPLTFASYTECRDWADELVSRLKPHDRFTLRQALSEPGRFYGAIGTIHDSTTIDVVMSSDGIVREVWFRCQALPYRVSYRPADRKFTPLSSLPAIVGVEVVDPPSRAD